MGRLKSVLRIALRCIKAVVILVMMAVVATSTSLIYDFGKPLPFSGPDIFDPYRNIDSTHCWKKAVFHVHTRVEGIFNECDYWPGEVKEFLDRLGYDIVTFSNHNELTEHPSDSTLQVNVYEHGYNLFKFHKLVFGSEEVNRFDHLLPLFASQWQFQFDMLGKESDIIQFNHPLRTTGTTKRLMERVGGYDIMELDCGKSTENEYWDWALSAGHYSFGLANDDLHYPDRSSRFAIRCSYLGAENTTKEDIIAALKSGCYYSVRIPDYGAGDWELKRQKNMELPEVTNIGLRGDTIYMKLSAPAEQIRVIGQNHTLLSRAMHSDSIAYTMQADDAYARIVASYPDSLIIMSNPFARYDSATMASPADREFCTPNLWATALYNTIIVALLGIVVCCYVKILRRWRR